MRGPDARHHVSSIVPRYRFSLLTQQSLQTIRLSIHCQISKQAIECSQSLALMACLANDPGIVFGVHVAAFLPLTVICALELTSPKHNHICTARHGKISCLLSSMPPLALFAFHIHPQKLAADFQRNGSG
eukprot:IDg5321t1